MRWEEMYRGAGGQMVGDCAEGEGGGGRGQLHRQMGADHSLTQQACHQINCIQGQRQPRLRCVCYIDTTFEHRRKDQLSPVPISCIPMLTSRWQEVLQR